MRTDRGETKTSFYPGFYQTSVEEKGVEVIREIYNHVYDKYQTQVHFSRGGGILLGILDGGVPPGSPLSQRPLPVSAA